MNRAERRSALSFVRATRDEWHPFERVYAVEPAFARFGDVQSCHRNNVYSVQVYRRANAWERVGDLLHLVVRRHDGTPSRSWADLQRIKNELVGPHRVAFEVFPEASDVTDQANLYHLFVLPEGHRFPFSLKGSWA